MTRKALMNALERLLSQIPFFSTVYELYKLKDKFDPKDRDQRFYQEEPRKYQG